MIASPCNKVCVIDPQHDWCRGCYRTLDEIARWGTMTDAERAAVLERIGLRHPGAAEPAPRNA